MSKVFLTSDNHFSHRNISKFCPKTRPDSDIDEMNRKMIARWQEQVAPDDDVFVLGDVFFCDYTKALSIINQLPGNKYLIYGNHDKVIRDNKKLQEQFISVQEYKEIYALGALWCFFHYPIMEWHDMHKGAYHCHGHIHERHNPMTEHLVECGRIANVCVDSPTFGTGDYSLYELHVVKSYLDTKPIRKYVK